MYDAMLGRFLERDPIGFAAGDVNLYEYLGDDPAISTDPSGEFVPDTYFEYKDASRKKKEERKAAEAAKSVAVYDPNLGTSGYERTFSEPTKFPVQSVKEAIETVEKHVRDHRTCIDQLSFYGHGTSGLQVMGSGKRTDVEGKKITSETLKNLKDDFSRICSSLCNGATVRFYGCKVGWGPAGRQFLTDVATLCKAKQITVIAWTSDTDYSITRIAGIPIWSSMSTSGEEIIKKSPPVK